MTMAALQAESDSKDELIHALRANGSSEEVRALRAENAALRAENGELRAEKDQMLGAQSLLEFHDAKRQKTDTQTGTKEINENDLYDAFVRAIDERARVIELMQKVVCVGTPQREMFATARVGKRAFSKCLRLMGGNMVKRNNTRNVFTNVGVRST
jgi:hypothetical protein